MQFSTIAIVALAATAQAGVVKKIAKGVFGRDELEQVLIQARSATEAEWVGKIANWNKPVPVGMSPEAQAILKSSGCNPPSGAKAKRSLDSEVSDQHLILVRNSNTVYSKSDALAAAKNPALLPQTVKEAFSKAGWTGACAGGAAAPAVAARDLEFDDYELYAREFDDEFYYEY